MSVRLAHGTDIGFLTAFSVKSHRAGVVSGGPLERTLAVRLRGAELAFASNLYDLESTRASSHTWVEFVVGSLLCCERFSSRYYGIPLS